MFRLESDVHTHTHTHTDTHTHTVEFNICTLAIVRSEVHICIQSEEMVILGGYILTLLLPPTCFQLLLFSSLLPPLVYFAISRAEECIMLVVALALKACYLTLGPLPAWSRYPRRGTGIKLPISHRYRFPSVRWLLIRLTGGLHRQPIRGQLGNVRVCVWGSRLLGSKALIKSRDKWGPGRCTYFRASSWGMLREL